jgi:hypothetical protein
MSSRSHGGISLQSKCQRIETRREAAAGAAGAMGIINRIRTDGVVRAICNIAGFISWPNRWRRRGIRARVSRNRRQDGRRNAAKSRAKHSAHGLSEADIYKEKVVGGSGQMGDKERRWLGARTRNWSANKRLILGGEDTTSGNKEPKGSTVPLAARRQAATREQHRWCRDQAMVDRPI